VHGRRVRRCVVVWGVLVNGRRYGLAPLGSNDRGTLEDQVDLIARRLRRTERQQVALSSAVSHELRAPLASLRAMVEALADGVVEDPAEVRRYYASILSEIGHLSRMLDDLAAATRLGPRGRGDAVRLGRRAARPASASSR